MKPLVVGIIHVDQVRAHVQFLSRLSEGPGDICLTIEVRVCFVHQNKNRSCSAGRSVPVPCFAGLPFKRFQPSLAVRYQQCILTRPLLAAVTIELDQY